MHPHVQYELMQARTADLHRQAERRQLALAARQARRARHERQHPAPRRSDLAQRLWCMLLGWQPSRRSAS